MLTCPNCGNTRGWRNAIQTGGRQTATCGGCGYHVTSTGGTRMGTVSGDMTQTRPASTKKNRKSGRGRNG